MQKKNKHKFDFKDRHKLDNAERRKNLPPHRTLLDLGLKENDIMADLGSGIGYFTFPASGIVRTKRQDFCYGYIRREP